MNQSLAKRFLDFEVENKLFQGFIRGQCFWEVVRYTIFQLISRETYQVKSAQIAQKRSYVKKTKELFAYLCCRFRWIFRESKPFDLLLFSYARKKMIDGKNVNIHMYPLAKHLGQKLKILVVDPGELGEGAHEYPCPVFHIRPLYLVSRIKSLFMGFREKERLFFFELREKIKKTFHVDVDVYSIAKTVYAPQITLYKELLRFLRGIKPSIIIYCDTGNMKPLNMAAHALGIKTIDYQHGVISDRNVIYNYHRDLPLDHLKVSNADVLFTFGDFWKPHCHVPGQVVAVGFPNFEMPCHSKITSSGRKEKTILITSVFAVRDLLCQLAMTLAERRPDLTVLYKLRPEEHVSWQKQYPKSFQNKQNIIVIQDEWKSMYDYMDLCGYQVSADSLTLYEGMARGLIPIVLKIGCYEEMNAIYEGGYAFLVSTTEEILEIIDTQKKPKRVLSKELLFKPDSLKNVECFLSSFIRPNESTFSTYLQ